MINMKNKTIDVMMTLLGYAKQLPMFSFDFDIEANNDSIEEYFNSTGKLQTDWNGNPLPDEEIKLNIESHIKSFKNSNGYNPNGNSTITFYQTITINDIRYDKIYELVSGKNNQLPAGYTFCGNVKLTEFDKI